MSKLLRCALPVTVTNATLINGALWAAMRSCVNLTDANELTQYYIYSAAKRLPSGPFKVPPMWAPLQQDANGQISYVMYTASWTSSTSPAPPSRRRSKARAASR